MSDIPETWGMYDMPEHTEVYRGQNTVEVVRPLCLSFMEKFRTKLSWFCVHKSVFKLELRRMQLLIQVLEGGIWEKIYKCKIYKRYLKEMLQDKRLQKTNVGLLRSDVMPLGLKIQFEEF